MLRHHFLSLDLLLLLFLLRLLVNQQPRSPARCWGAAAVPGNWLPLEVLIGDRDRDPPGLRPRFLTDSYFTHSPQLSYRALHAVTTCYQAET